MLHGKVITICWKVYIMKKFDNYGSYYNPYRLLFRLSLACTEKEKNLRLAFFLWVLCTMHKTHKYGKMQMLS